MSTERKTQAYDSLAFLSGGKPETKRVLCISVNELTLELVPTV